MIVFPVVYSCKKVLSRAVDFRSWKGFKFTDSENDFCQKKDDI